MRVVDLSCDLGEADTPAACAQEEQLWSLVTSANVACGGHTGDLSTMLSAARTARANGVRFGAHPSYPDRAGFGRRTIDISEAALTRSIVEQLRAIERVAATEGIELLHVKPHGALYNDAHHDRGRARSIVEAVKTISTRLAIVCSDQSVLADVVRQNGLIVEPEAFGDRRYRCDGSLAPRSVPGAVLHEPAEAAGQVVSLGEKGEAVAECGRSVAVQFSTICLHGDMEGAVDRLKAVREALLGRGAEISSRERHW